MNKEQVHLKIIALNTAITGLPHLNISPAALTENAAVIYGFLIEDTRIVYPEDVLSIE